MIRTLHKKAQQSYIKSINTYGFIMEISELAEKFTYIPNFVD